ncbi:MAG: hypothetical protein K0R24_2124 [Gammaproteobacteria bacterium]|nr:hypothetical protein [Gammaproteobacteria bacterium]
MNQKLSLDELKGFTRADKIFRSWIHQVCYTEGVKYLADKTDSYGLIDEIARVILPSLLKEHKKKLYVIELSVSEHQSMAIIISDGNGTIYLTHPINWTDFPVGDKNVKLYLCKSKRQYCLMLPNEY